jgi:hypothetical protein
LISEAEQKASREKRSKLADQPYNLAAVMRVFAISLTLAIVGGSFEGAHPAARQSAAPVASASASRHRAVVEYSRQPILKLAFFCHITIVNKDTTLSYADPAVCPIADNPGAHFTRRFA